MAVTPEATSARLAAWLVYVGIFTTLQYGAYFSGDNGSKVPSDFLYRYSSAVAGVAQFLIMLGIALLIAIGAPKRELFALRRPNSWGRAVVISVVVLVTVYVLSGVIGLFLDPGREQGFLPDRWRPDRAGQYAANFVVIVVLVPIVEELTFRGLGFTLLRRFGETTAIVLIGILFAGAHGLVEAFPIIAAFGMGLAFLRSRTESIYPGICLHALFNAIAMLAVFGRT
jgi:membrane protease YdiL (CAAX protease family)